MILRTIGGISDVVLQVLEDVFGPEYIYTWGGFNHHQDWALDAYAKAITENRKVICAETPLIGRNLFNENSHILTFE